MVSVRARWSDFARSFQRQPRGSLRRKIIIWSFVPTAIILIAVAFINFQAYRLVTEDLVIERDRELPLRGIPADPIQHEEPALL